MSYGAEKAEEIRTRENFSYNSLTGYEQFILNQGHRFDSEEKLKEGYERMWKAGKDIILTFDEFEKEAVYQWHDFDTETLKTAYNRLVNLVRRKAISTFELYEYARQNWCLKHPEAIKAWQIDNGRWAVNNCSEEISKEKAQLAVAEEWGFNAVNVTIVDTPYYENCSDWQCIRFNCRGATWLWLNGDIYRVME